MTLDNEYQDWTLAAIKEVHRRSDYYAHRWEQMVVRHGAVEATKRQLRKPPAVMDGGQRLTDLGLDEYSIEWAVLNPHWETLFSREDRAIAYEMISASLRQHGARAPQAV